MPLADLESDSSATARTRPPSSFVVLGGSPGNMGIGVGLALALAMVVAVAILDYATGYELRLAILYLLPIALATWIGGGRFGTGVSLVSVAVWFLSFRYSNPYTRDVFYYWEGAVTITTFGIFVFLLTRLRGALARADERFARVLEGLYAGVYVVDESGTKLLYANQRLSQIVNADASTLRASEIERRFALAGGPASFVSAEMHDETDGRWYLVQAGSIPWVDDKPARLKVVSDISEQKQAQQLRREHQEALHHNARLVALAEIASALAHELNQPLMAIVGYNEACLRLLAARRHDRQRIVQAMEKCRDQAVRAGQIIHRMRDFIRRREPALAPVNINAVVRDAVRTTETDCERAGITVEFILSDSLPVVPGDAVLIGQVLVNLMSNAADALCAVDPKRRRIAVSTAIAQDGVRVTVSDRGEGIPAAMRERLYQPFFTTKSEGLGLGLSICRSVIEAHGGQLWHEENPDGGSVFHFLLPARTE